MKAVDIVQIWSNELINFRRLDDDGEEKMWKIVQAKICFVAKAIFKI